MYDGEGNLVFDRQKFFLYEFKNRPPEVEEVLAAKIDVKTVEGIKGIDNIISYPPLQLKKNSCSQNEMHTKFLLDNSKYNLND